MINVAELDERIERCLAILAGNPHSQVFAALADAYRRRGEFGRAFAVCKSGLKHHPDYASAHIVLAKLYQHQKMFPDAFAALNRAIELDGPTRATEILEAELHLAAGDIDQARSRIDRLRHTEPHNPSVAALAKQLREKKAIHKNGALSAVDSANEDPAPPPEPGGTPAFSVPASPAKEPVNWEQWAVDLGRYRGVEYAFASDASSEIVALAPKTQPQVNTVAAVSTVFHDIDQILRHSGEGALTELRVEADQCEFWSRRFNGFVLSIIGQRSMSFGEVRRRALGLAGSVTETRQGEPDDPGRETKGTTENA